LAASRWIENVRSSRKSRQKSTWRPNKRRPLFDLLEDRTLLSTVFAITPTNDLLRFDSATPGAIDSTAAVTGLQPGESVLGLDFRPATGQLYALGSTSRLYTLDVTTAAATQVGSGTFSPALSG